jgi:hypothetical protein
VTLLVEKRPDLESDDIYCPLTVVFSDFSITTGREVPIYTQ